MLTVPKVEKCNTFLQIAPHHKTILWSDFNFNLILRNLLIKVNVQLFLLFDWTNPYSYIFMNAYMNFRRFSPG